MNKEDIYIELAKMIETRDKDVDKFVSLFAEISKEGKNWISFFFWMKKNCPLLYIFFLLVKKSHENFQHEPFCDAMRDAYIYLIIDDTVEYDKQKKSIKGNAGLN